MSRKFLVGIDLNKNELQNAVIQNLGTAPSSPLDGQIYYNTSDDTIYFWDGSTWQNVLQSNAILADTYANRPAAGAGNSGKLFFATDYQIMYYSNGTSWAQVSNFGNVSAQTSYGDTSSNGSSNSYARADHTHGTPSLSTNTPQATSIGGSGSAGSGTLPSKDDHVHAGPGFGNVTAQTSFGASSANGSATTVAHSDHTHGTPTLDNTAVASINISALSAPIANVSWGGYKITSLADPSSDQDAATKSYVDSVAQGLNVHDSVVAASTANLTATYSNGSSGVGATLTNSGTQAALSLDGISPSVGQRVLIKDQTTAAQNGIYVVTDAGSGSTNWILTRSTDFDTTAEMGGGDFVFVTSGSTLDNTGWVCIDKVTTVGTTPVVFTQFSGAGTYSAGNGLSLTGTTFAAVASTGISVSGSGIAIDTSVVVRKYSADIGDNSSTSIAVSHGLNTKDVQVTVYDNSSPYAEVICDVQHTSTSAVTLIFTVAPTTNQYRVVVQG